MALAITEDHKALGEVIRSFAADHEMRRLSRAALHGSLSDVPQVWKQIAELGWLGLHVAEEYGGSGYGLPELAVLADELGYYLTPGPVIPTIVASALLGRRGTAEQRAACLPGLVDGSLRAGVALHDGLAKDAGGLISGTIDAVLGGRWADLLLLRLGDDMVLVRADDPSVRLEPIGGLDPSLGLARVRVQGLSGGSSIENAASAAITLLRTVISAEAAGGARAALDMAVEYAKVREQFGRTIGTFQAVKHHLANMLVAVELATAVSWDAARASDDGEGELAAAAAASQALPAYRECAQKNIQVLGGIGFTWEHDAHLYLRRAAALSALAAACGSAEDAVYELVAAGVRRHFAVDLPPEAERYRRQGREFLAAYHATAPEARRALLVDSGYLVPHWPAPFGRNAGPVEQLVIDEELAEVELPDLGIAGWVLLTLVQTATDEQLARWVKPGLLGELKWCQLFSEPNAGSDAAAVRTRGVKSDGGWRVTGQKVWTSGAEHGNRGLATIRTDPGVPKHKGITAMVIDLKAPGVEVRPLREITGESWFSEVFFNDVFVPDADVVGEVNDGWRVARATLGNERTSIGGGTREGVTALELVTLAARRPADVGARRTIARLLVEEQAMSLINLRRVTRVVAGSSSGPEGSVTKLLVAEHHQRVSETAMALAGTAAISGEDERLTHDYLFSRCSTIAGGTSEITRNVIAERILGLPRDPLVR